MHEVGLTLESDHRFDRSVGIEASAVLTLMRTMFVVIAMLVGVFVGWFLGAYLGYGLLWFAESVGVRVIEALYSAVILFGIAGSAAGGTGGAWFASRASSSEPSKRENHIP